MLSLSGSLWQQPRLLKSTVRALMTAGRCASVRHTHTLQGGGEVVCAVTCHSRPEGGLPRANRCFNLPPPPPIMQVAVKVQFPQLRERCEGDVSTIAFLVDAMRKVLRHLWRERGKERERERG